MPVIELQALQVNPCCCLMIEAYRLLSDAVVQVPICYPFIESFRLSLLAMSHRDFPFNVLGAVLARNTSTVYRKLAADEALTYRFVHECEFTAPCCIQLMQQSQCIRPAYSRGPMSGTSEIRTLQTTLPWYLSFNVLGLFFLPQHQHSKFNAGSQ